MRDSRRNIISVTHIHVHSIARIVSVDDSSAFKKISLV